MGVGFTMKCKGKNKDGSACKNDGRPETGDLCFTHWKESQGLQPDELRVRFLKGYKNGMVGVVARELEERTIMRGQLQQILADDPHALEVLNG